MIWLKKQVQVQVQVVQAFSSDFCKTFKNSFFVQHLQTAETTQDKTRKFFCNAEAKVKINLFIKKLVGYP